ncbi:hypothetical protein [Bradyrhizobium sp. Gha]|uniref:hypothetical protein n=1 Tax=Bradyrhizobium sp. Gha TaxID=1855318 RepID=UPI0008E6E240|nr:hypothetical protein [Bradyrhizobium sp. Gha]SFI47265.1 hypothetical protein SAMN05216525_10977 [Bradyrhizobium sp. Gha]
MSAQYRAYLVGEDGVFRSVEAFEAPSDTSALAYAQRFARRGDVEVWQLGRKIGFLKGPSPPEAKNLVAGPWTQDPGTQNSALGGSLKLRRPFDPRLQQGDRDPQIVAAGA